MAKPEPLTKDERRVVDWCLQTEIEACQRDFQRPDRQPRGIEDPRYQHMRLLQTAQAKIRAMR